MTAVPLAANREGSSTFHTLPVQELWPSEEHLRQQWPRAGGGQETAGPTAASTGGSSLHPGSNILYNIIISQKVNKLLKLSK